MQRIAQAIYNKYISILCILLGGLLLFFISKYNFTFFFIIVELFILGFSISIIFIIYLHKNNLKLHYSNNNIGNNNIQKCIIAIGIIWICASAFEFISVISFPDIHILNAIDPKINYAQFRISRIDSRIFQLFVFIILFSFIKNRKIKNIIFLKSNILIIFFIFITIYINIFIVYSLKTIKININMPLIISILEYFTLVLWIIYFIVLLYSHNNISKNKYVLICFILNILTQMIFAFFIKYKVYDYTTFHSLAYIIRLASYISLYFVTVEYVIKKSIKNLDTEKKHSPLNIEVFNLIAALSPYIIIILDNSYNIIYANQYCISELFKNNFIYKNTNIFEILGDSNDFVIYKHKIEQSMKFNNIEKFFFEPNNNESKFYEMEVFSIQNNYEDNKLVVLLGKDISSIQNAEKLQQMSYSHRLSFLPNRSKMKKDFDKINLPENYPITFLLCDINGLKLINNSYGFQVGDEIIIEIANFLRKLIPEEYEVYHIGGDDFVIILKNAVKNDIKTMINIMDHYINENKDMFHSVTMSYGIATMDKESTSLEDLYRIAEEKMLAKKMSEEKSTKSSIIQSLTQTLNEKTHETEEHSNRMEQLCIVLGQAYDLEQADISKLILIAKLHDIGKIAISDKILDKPTSLTNEEWIIMQTHCEIGYRIALASGELSSIADSILTHHERWDGNGYPNKLKGEEIPVLARIIAIVDSYDAMTNDRVYRKALSKEEALEEIRNNSGKQFDPNISNAFLKLIDYNVF